MANINTVSLTGRLVRDVELRATANGMSVANVAIAVSDYKDNTSFIDLVFFSKTAEIASEYLSKGSHIGITGRLQQRSWEDKAGSKRSTIEVVVNELELPPKSAGTPPTDSEETVLLDIDDLSEIPFN